MTGPAADPGRGPAGPGQTLFRFVRRWSRRTIGGGSGGERGRDVWVTEAVHALAGQGEVTVNGVAAELGIDQSGASRMITAAVGHGYLRLTPSRTDARRRSVTLTMSGQRLLEAAHAWQEQIFTELTADWTPDERAQFHRGMLRLIGRN